MSFLLYAMAINVAVLANDTPRTQFDGEFTQGGLVIGRTVPGAKVMHDGQAVRVAADGLFLLGFGRDAKATTALDIHYPDGQRESQNLPVTQRDYDIQRIEGVPKKMVTPPESALARIRADTAMIKKARKRDDDRQDFVGGFIWPVNGKVTGVYGSQRVYNGQPRRPHYGIDIAAPNGTPVVAPAAGVVTLAHDDMYFSGGTLIIDHGMGLSSAFLHLSELLVDVGDDVERGAVVAKVGATGRSTGPHLDWRINLFNKRIDAALIAPPLPSQ